MDTEKNTGGLDVFKIIAAFLVIAIHTSPLAGFNAGARSTFDKNRGSPRPFPFSSW